MFMKRWELAGISVHREMHKTVAFLLIIHKQPDHSPRKNQLHVFYYLLFMVFPDNHQHGTETYAKEDRVYTKEKGDSLGEFSLGKWNDPFWSLARLSMLPCGKWDELGGTGERRPSRRLFTKIGQTIMTYKT